MAGHQFKVSNVKSNIPMNYENYSTWLQAFKETREEENSWALTNNQLKGLNN